MRIFHNQKGLSPIFAALVMLGIITILFIPVFIWSSGLTEGTRSFWERSGMIATERIVIEEINLKGGSSDCTIYVRNIGKTATVISDIFISDESSGQTYSYDRSKFETWIWDQNGNLIRKDSPSIIQGDLMRVYIPTGKLSPLGPQTGKTYNVKIFTMMGVGDVSQVKA